MGTGGWGAPEGPPPHRSMLTLRCHCSFLWGVGGAEVRGYVRPSKCRGVPGVVLVLPHVVPGVWVKMQRLGMKPRSLGLLAPESLIFQGSRVFLGGKKKRESGGGGGLNAGCHKCAGDKGGVAPGSHRRGAVTPPGVLWGPFTPMSSLCPPLTAPLPHSPTALPGGEEQGDERCWGHPWVR